MKTLLQRQSITSQGGFYEPKEGHAKVRQEHHCEQQEVHRIHGRGTSRDERVPPRAEGIRGPRLARGQGGRGKRRAREESGELRPGIWGVFRCMVYPCVTRADPRRSGRSGPLSPAFFCNVSTVPHSSSPNNGSSSFPTACHIPIDEMLSRTGCFF